MAVTDLVNIERLSDGKRKITSISELAGIKDIRTKCLRSNNKRNVVSATIQGLSELKQAEAVAKLRGKTVDQIKG